MRGVTTQGEILGHSLLSQPRELKGPHLGLLLIGS